MSPDLKTRLGKLRGAAGGARWQPSVERNSVVDRLSRAALARQPRTTRMSDRALARQWGGEVTAAGLIEIEHRVALADDRVLALHKTLRGTLPDFPVVENDAWVFMDTETTGLAGGSGTLAFLLGLARPAKDALIVRQFLLTSFGGETAMLARAAQWIGAAGFISYNGRSFDAPLLATRCRMNGLADWVSKRAHLDLLYGIRRAFARAWSDCRLASVEQRLLGIERRDDLPGADAPAAWFAHVRSGDASRLSKVLNHNRQDVVSLAHLVPKLVDVYARPRHLNADIEAVALCWLKSGNAARAVTLLEQHRTDLTGRGLHILARQHRRAGNWLDACRIWRELAAQRDHEAIEQLAKYYEHVCKDTAAALHWTAQLPHGDARSKRELRLLRKGIQSASSLSVARIAGNST